MREETCCQDMGYSFQVTASVLLYAQSHRQDGLCYTSRGLFGWKKKKETLLPWSYISLPYLDGDRFYNCDVITNTVILGFMLSYILQ